MEDAIPNAGLHDHGGLRGYDYPVKLQSIPVGSRFAHYSDATAWGLLPEIQSGTLLWAGVGSCEVWWDHETKPNRCQPELDVWIMDPRPMSEADIFQYCTQPEGQGDMADTITMNPAIKALNARWNFQLGELIKSLEGDDKAKAAICMSRLEKAIYEARQLRVSLPPVPPALTGYEPLMESLAASKVEEEQKKQAKEAAAQRVVDRELAKEKHINEVKSAPRSTATNKPKADKKLRPCLDGCGIMVPGNFSMGHDAKLKSLLIKIEKGEKTPEDVPEVAMDLIRIVKGEAIQELDSQGGKKGEPRQTWKIVAAPVKFPGRDDIQLTKRDD